MSIDALHSYSFLALNDDGFGVRLGCLINAITLADIFDANAKMIWRFKSSNRYHDILPIDQTFSRDFIDKYLLAPDSFNYAVKPLLHDFLNDLRANKIENGSIYRATLKIDGLIGRLIKNKDIGLEEQDISRIQSKAFDKIEFNDDLETAKEHARSLDLPSNVSGLHMRGGDVLHGSWRMTGFYINKTFELPTVVNLLQEKLNNPVIIFSNDNEACEYIKKRCSNLLFANDLKPRDYTSLQSAIFDITLMSRCKQIYAGHSGFSISAMYAGMSQIISFKNIYADDERTRLIFDYLSLDENLLDMPAHLLRHCCLVALTYSISSSSEVNCLDFEEELQLCKLGQLCDDTATFHFFEMITFVKHGMIAKSAELFDAVVRNSKSKRLLFQFIDFNTRNKSIANFFSAAGYLELLQEIRCDTTENDVLTEILALSNKALQNR
jgi:hypothetical protein